MSHDDDTCPHLVVLGRLEAENARLKAEVAIQNERINRRDMDVGQLYCENARLKAEVERLTLAGDAMAAHIERNDERCYIVLPDGDIRISEWNAAKEGKQP